MPANTADGHAPRVLVVMGVAGSGKSTLGRLLAERLGSAFQEGDDFHPPANVAKMRAGIPLTDEDRWPWLDRAAAWVEARLRKGESGVLTCSALKRAYRERLAPHGGVVFVYPVLQRETIHERLVHRAGHYMPASLLASQLETLEEPGPDEPVVRVDATAPTEELVSEVVEQLCAADGVPRQG